MTNIYNVLCITDGLGIFEGLLPGSTLPTFT